MDNMRHFVCLVLFVFTVNGNNDYQGYHVFSAKPQSESQVQELAGFLISQDGVDIWELPKLADKSARFMVPGGGSEQVHQWLTQHDIMYRLVTDNIQSDILAATLKDASSHANSRLSSHGLDLDRYNSHNDMNNWLSNITTQCDICKIIYIGQTIEGRAMEVIRVGTWSNNRPVIWIDAGIHAREWLAPATALHIINKLVSGHESGDPDVEWLLEHFLFYILPCANPDGYEYSSQVRLWRKNREPTRDPDCVGTDLNRNWGYKWAVSGVSFDRCSDIYPGSRAFSCRESRHIRRFLWLRRKSILVYLSLHSYGRYWLYPWGFNSSLPWDSSELHRVGQRAVHSIQESGGPAYSLGSSTNVLYAAAGASDDWAKGVAGIKYSYTIELPAGSEYGFLMPESEIGPSFREIWPGIQEMAYAVQETVEDQGFSNLVAETYT